MLKTSLLTKSVIVSLALFLVGCDNNSDNESPVENGSVSFQFTGPITIDGNVDLPTPSKISYSLDSEGEEISGELTLTALGDSYASSPLELLVGRYTLETFIVLDNNDQSIYVSPKEGSDYAHLVDNPLPIDFVVEAEKETTLSPEVILIEEGSTPEEYGYTSFTLNIVGYHRINVNTSYVALNPPAGDLNYDLSVRAMDADGTTQWEHTFDLITGEKSITIPSEYQMYCFESSHPDFRVHKQCYPFTEIEEHNELGFELLPSDPSELHDVGIEIEEMADVLFYHAIDPCTEYARIDFISDRMFINYISVDIAFIDEHNNSAPSPSFSLLESFAPINNAVNLWNGAPFSESRNRCEELFGNSDPATLIANDIHRIQSLSQFLSEDGQFFVLAHKNCPVDDQCETDVTVN